jgi:hypothetical protein
MQNAPKAAHKQYEISSQLVPYQLSSFFTADSKSPNAHK